MVERDLDAKQYRLLAALEDVDMLSELKEQPEGVLRAWIEKQRAVDRLWDLHSKPKDAE